MYDNHHTLEFDDTLTVSLFNSEETAHSPVFDGVFTLVQSIVFSTECIEYMSKGALTPTLFVC